MTRNIFRYNELFELESGQSLPGLEIGYYTSEPENHDEKPVVWICHALTANANPFDWWPDLVGEGKLFDPGSFFIVCANIIGSSYGSTSPKSVNPATGKPYLNDFPLISVRDWVKAHEILCDHLGIERVHTLIGGSIGGFQAMEWAIVRPDRFQHLVLLATSYFSHPWSIAINEAERMAIESDTSFFSGDPEGGKAGLAAARAIGMLTYRGYKAFELTQTDPDPEKFSGFRAATYQQYQGQKLANRFNAHCYYSITKSQDTHHVGRNRPGVESALRRIKAPTMVIGISSDILFPVTEQENLARMIPKAELSIISSDYGHDGFLVEHQKISEKIRKFWKEPIQQKSLQSTREKFPIAC